MLEKSVWRFVESVRKKPSLPVNTELVRTSGCCYDLREVFDAINASCFEGRLRAIVRWGRKNSKTSFHAERKDRQGKGVNVITIAGLYDRPHVPRFAIEGIMHHEMLHIAVPPYGENGRRVVHGQEFRATERAFTHHRAWKEWERKLGPAAPRKGLRNRFLAAFFR